MTENDDRRLFQMNRLNHTQSEPRTLTVAEEEVMMDGPSGVTIFFTPEAARVTGQRLIAAANDCVRLHNGGDAPATEAAGSE